MNEELENAAARAAESIKALAKEAAGYRAATPPVSFQPAKTMLDAAELAAEHCDRWYLSDDEDHSELTKGDLYYISEQQDLRLRLSLADTEQYYLVLPDGSVGITMDGCRSIEWVLSGAKSETEAPA